MAMLEMLPTWLQKTAMLEWGQDLLVIYCRICNIVFRSLSFLG